MSIEDIIAMLAAMKTEDRADSLLLLPDGPQPLLAESLDALMEILSLGSSICILKHYYEI